MQASYFKENGLDTKNAILADNGYYLFNDWLQALLEIGLNGVVLLALLTLLFRKLYRYEAKANRWLFAANTTLIFISVSALFNYPLQTPIILFSFIICVIIHCYHSYKPRTIIDNFKFKAIKNNVLLVCTFATLAYCGLIYYYKQQSKKAYELNLIGQKDESEKIYKELSNLPFADYYTLLNYSKKSLYTNQPEKALELINQSLTIVYSYEGVKLKAEILNALHDTKNEEHYLIEAVYMIPNRIRSKLNLMKFYIEHNEFAKAKYWGNIILTMKVKIPSPEADNLLNQTKQLLTVLK